MIHEFELWSASRTDTNHFSDLSGAVLAIEADFYLDRLLNNSPAKEPLLSALAGLPFSFRSHVEHELGVLQSWGVKPIFVFSGLEQGKNYAPFEEGENVAERNRIAWDLYIRHEAQEAVDNFGNSGYATPRRFYRFLQTVLRGRNIDFQVAPYSAVGQLAYLSRNTPDHVNAIAGSSEILLFDIDRVITGLDFPQNEFTFIRKQQCVEELGGVPPEMFTDACMLAGCSLLPPIPIAARPRIPKVKHVIDLMKANGQTGYSLCTQFQDHQGIREMDYIDRYKRSRLAVKHEVVLTLAGKVEPLAADDAPSDLHEIIGQRLPDELYYYLSVAAIGPRVLNQLTSAHVYDQCPADGGESEAYKILVSEKLRDSRTTTLALLAWNLHRAYQHRKVQFSTWSSQGRQSEVSLNEVSDPRPIVHQWKVPESSFPPGVDLEQSVIGSAVRALHEPSFVAKTKGNKARLQQTSELKMNAVWRFLHLRGYIDNEHRLTAWGKVLLAMVEASSSASEQEEGLLLAAELLRLDLLSSENMFPSYNGAPMHGSEKDKANTLLLARIACLGKLRHKSIGFTGPLSRHLLGYSSIVDAVRMSLRDLLETCLITMLLSGDAAKERTDLTDIALDLPFLLPNDCALGIAMKHYLDDVAMSAPSSGGITPEVRQSAKDRGPTELFPHVENFSDDLEKGFQLWDAVSA